MDAAAGTRLARGLGLDRNTGAVAAAVFLMGLGEQLWKRFVPKYLEAMGAPVLAIGGYGAAGDFLDGVYQYPGGWIADRWGRRRALTLFVALAGAGYAVYALAPSWPWLFAGLALSAAWASMASPALFAAIGDSLPRGRRAVGFAVQSLLRRVPIAVAPALGGLAIAAYGVRGGVRAGLAVSLALALATLAVVSRVRIPVAADAAPVRMADVWRRLPAALRWLLVSDVFVRTCEGMVEVFLVLYATNVVGISAPRYGLLVTVEMAAAILCYLPAARMAERTGQKPFVIATFLMFSLFPLAVVLSRSWAALALAFVVGGLREVGEPSRKALIVDLAEPGLRARTVGLYYLVRSVAITPASLVGGLLWRVSPQLPFAVACGIGLAGTAVFAATVHERHLRDQ